ncbi:hypothetical protein C8J57DRAFT_1227621 [Mycena rebaudengoi]|nr:hypothetical protein C8J57DRAFT_1227621 [Mycena rebaudengoi]
MAPLTRSPLTPLLLGAQASVRGLAYLISTMLRVTRTPASNDTSSQVLPSFHPGYEAVPMPSGLSAGVSRLGYEETAPHTSATFVPPALQLDRVSSGIFPSAPDVIISESRESYMLHTLPIRPLPPIPTQSSPSPHSTSPSSASSPSSSRSPSPPTPSTSAHAPRSAPTSPRQTPISRSERPFSPALPSINELEGPDIPLVEADVLHAHPAAIDSSASSQPGGPANSSLSPAPLLNELHPRISPGVPESLRRYDRKLTVPDKASDFTIPFLRTDSLDPPDPPAGWTAYIHPEGAQYFHHQEKRIFTDVNLFDPDLHAFIVENIDNIYDVLRVHGIELAAGVDLVLDEDVYSDGSKGCQYYFVHHKRRTVFWVDPVEASLFSVARELNGIKSPSHIRWLAFLCFTRWAQLGTGHVLQAQYWYHCELFPSSLEVTREIVDELRDIVLHALGDLVTSKTSTVSWKVEDLRCILTLTNGFATDKIHIENIGNKFCGSSCLVGRLMHEFARARVFNFHGEPGARLNVDQSVYDTVRKRTMLINLLGPLLFYAPDVHHVGLQKIFTDGLVRGRGWTDFIKRLNNEWTEFTLHATILLAGNVAFLSIQSVDQGGNSAATHSPAQIASYVSTLASIGSIIIGLLLAKQNRDRDAQTAPEAANYLATRTHPKLGLESLAILHSLPYALLVWSMVSFLAAFLFMCFQRSDFVTRMLVAMIWVAISALILWCIYNAWENSESRDWDWLRRLLRGGVSAEEADDGSEEAELETPSSEQPRKRRSLLAVFSVRRASRCPDCATAV